MKKITLCGHTGSFNHGCEAIIKSTADLLHRNEKEVILATHDLSGDEKFGIKEFDEVYEYANFTNAPIKRWVSVMFSRIFRMKNVSNYLVQKDIWSQLAGTTVMNVGGDTYCYAKPYPSIYLNKYCKKKEISNVLWACSIEADVINDADIREDLNKYQRIYPREILTYEALVDAGYPEDKLCLTCDPAFSLQSEIFELPKAFKIKKTVGINLSPTILAYASKPQIVFESYQRVIDHVLNTTDCSVALIPHVYKNGNEDVKILKQLYEKYIGNERVILIENELNCRQLKYIISQCCFLIAARTHASIAAYSSCVPTLVVGYSVKSKGIATDLFDSYENYVIPVQCIDNPSELLKAFIELYEVRDVLEKKLIEVIPGYSNRANVAINDFCERV